MEVKRIKPPSVATISVFLTVENVERALQYYKLAFGAVEIPPTKTETLGNLRFGELAVGNSTILLTDENSGVLHRTPATLGGTPMWLWIYVDDPDEVFQNAINGGAESISPMQDANLGCRVGAFRDPFGYLWQVANHPVEK